METEITRYSPEAVEALTLTRGENNARKIRGVASVYYNGSPGSQYQLDATTIERIAPGAFDALLSDDCIACVDHDRKTLVGRNGKTLRLWTTARGLEYEIDLKNTTAANDLWENVQAGNIKGSSFKAHLDLSDKSAVEWQREGKQDIMIIKRFKSLKDVSCVTQAAYAMAGCEAVMRSKHEFDLRLETAKRIERISKIIADING